MTTYERIATLCKRNNISITGLEKELGFGRGLIGKWRNMASPNSVKLQKIAEYFDVTIDYLMNGTEKNISKKGKGVKIPILGKVAAGIPIEQIEDIIGWEEITEDMASTGDYFCLQIKGDSMEPRMYEGDIVVVRQQDDADTGDIVIAQVNGAEATCKRLTKAIDSISLISLNPKYEPVVFTADKVLNMPVKIIGKVVELRAKL